MTATAAGAGGRSHPDTRRTAPTSSTSSAPSPTGDTPVAACWAGLAAVGTGLVHLALASQNRDDPVALACFLLAGAGSLLWGITTMSRPRPPLPRLAAAALACGVVAVGVLSTTGGGLLAGSTGGPGAAGTGAAVLQLIALAALLINRRRASGRHMTATSRWTGGPRARLVSVAVGALLVAAVTTPALAGTTAGEHARPHGHHLPQLHDGH